MIYEMVWFKWRRSLWNGYVNMMIPMKWVDVNEDGPFEMVLWIWWYLWNGLM